MDFPLIFHMFGDFRAFPKALIVSSCCTRFTASKHLGTLLAQKGFCFIKGSLKQAGLGDFWSCSNGMPSWP